MELYKTDFHELVKFSFPLKSSASMCQDLIVTMLFPPKVCLHCTCKNKCSTYRRAYYHVAL